MDITGTIIAVMPAQSGTSSKTGNTWMRQSYVLEVPGQWPRHMTFDIFGEDRIKQFNLHQGEQNITVQFDIDAHEFQGRWFNEIRAYNVIRPYAGARTTAGTATHTGRSITTAAASARGTRQSTILKTN